MSQRKTTYEVQSRWLVMRLTDDGLLKHPTNEWGDHAFSSYGYDSVEEANAEVRRNPGEYLLIPMVYTRVEL